MIRARRNRRRVVVTGCGAITPIGHTTSEFWSSLLAGRSGIGAISRFDPAELPVRIAGEVRGFDPAPYLPHKVSRRLDPFAQYALAAAQQAVEQAKLEFDADLADRVGVLVGSAYGPVQSTEQSRRTLAEHGARRVTPFFVATGSMDNAAGEIAMRFGARGPSAAITTACATGATCLGEATRHIQHDYADVMIAGGADDSLGAQIGRAHV